MTVVGCVQLEEKMWRLVGGRSGQTCCAAAQLSVRGRTASRLHLHQLHGNSSVGLRLVKISLDYLALIKQ